MTRQRAAQILKEYSADHPEFAARLAQVRMEAIEQRARLNRAQAERAERENAVYQGDYIPRAVQQEQGRAVARCPERRA